MDGVEEIESAEDQHRLYHLHRFKIKMVDESKEVILGFPIKDDHHLNDDDNKSEIVHGESIFAYLPVTRPGLRFAIQVFLHRCIV